MTHNIIHDEDKERTESEVAVFWDMFAQALPKSIERRALGDEKILRAFKIVYPEIKKFISLKAELTKSK